MVSYFLLYQNIYKNGFLLNTSWKSLGLWVTVLYSYLFTDTYAAQNYNFAMLTLTILDSVMKLYLFEGVSNELHAYYTLSPLTR